MNIFTKINCFLNAENKYRIKFKKKTSNTVGPYYFYQTNVQVWSRDPFVSNLHHVEKVRFFLSNSITIICLSHVFIHIYKYNYFRPLFGTFIWVDTCAIQISGNYLGRLKKRHLKLLFYFNDKISNFCTTIDFEIFVF